MSPRHPSTPSARTESSEKGLGQDDAGGASRDTADVTDSYEETQGGDDDEDEDEDGEKTRTRFRAERRENPAMSSTGKRREEIPDSLDAVISAEDAAKVDAYLSREEERKRSRRGGTARGIRSFQKRCHRGAGGNKPLPPHIDPWMPHSGPLALQQGRFLSPNLGGGPQRRFPAVPCMNDNNMRGKIFVNPQFHNGSMPPRGPGMHNDGVGMGRPPPYQQLNHPHQQGGLYPMRPESFPFMRPPVPSRPEQRVPPFSQNPGNGRGFQRPPHASQTTYANNGPHPLAPAQFSTAMDRFVPTSRPGLEPFEMPPPHIDFGPGRNGEFPPRRDIDPWVHPAGSGHHGIAPGARQQSQPFGSPPHYTNAPLQPPQQHHMSSPVPAHPFPVVSQHQHCPPPQISQSAGQPPQEQHYQHRPPPHFHQQQGAPPQMMHASHPPPPHPPHHHHGPPPPPMQPPLSPSHPASSPGGGFGATPVPATEPPFGRQVRGVLRKRGSPSEGAGQGPLLPCPQPKVGRMDSPRSSRPPMGRTVNSSNIKEVPIVENLPPPEPVKVSLPKEVEEDSATLELRRKIEEQKKLREQVLRIKAERRKLAAMQRQRDVMEKNLHSGMGDTAQKSDSAAVVAEATATAAPNKQQILPVQRVQPPEKPAVSVKQRLGLKPSVQQDTPSPVVGGPVKKVVIVRRNPSQQPAIPQQKLPNRNVISLCPQGPGVRHPLRGRGGISVVGRGAGRSVVRPSLPPQQQQQPQCAPNVAKKVIKIVPATRGRIQGPSVRGGGGDVAQRLGHQGGHIPPTTQVLVNNLSASTTEAQLKQLGSTCGVITGIVLDRNQRRAVIGFQDQQQAFTFQKKYQRHMFDLSMIQVSLLPP
ncbi:RNA-binding protein 33-like [Ornithodoros turicata]|uniref:RNA-binding protein 33-like n=1 Tax=Ornithodoros turicata TaxID=34597 RepID=UPI00313959A4